MRRLKLVGKVVVIILLLSTVDKGYVLMTQGTGDYRLVNMLLAGGLLILSIIWLLLLSQKKSGAKMITALFMIIPIVAALGQTAYIWVDNADSTEAIFKAWFTLCIAAVTLLYSKYALGWWRRVEVLLKEAQADESQV